MLCCAPLVTIRAMQLRFHECLDHIGWECEIPLGDFDPFGKGSVTLETEELMVPAAGLEQFADEFLNRYEALWPQVRGLLLDKGRSWSELLAAHQRTSLDIWEASGFPPDEWDLTYAFRFENGYTLDYSLSFEGWETDDRLVGTH